MKGNLNFEKSLEVDTLVSKIGNNLNGVRVPPVRVIPVYKKGGVQQRKDDGNVKVQRGKLQKTTKKTNCLKRYVRNRKSSETKFGFQCRFKLGI